jgi:hypothetical protein
MTTILHLRVDDAGFKLSDAKQLQQHTTDANSEQRRSHDGKPKHNRRPTADASTSTSSTSNAWVTLPFNCF